MSIVPYAIVPVIFLIAFLVLALKSRKGTGGAGDYGVADVSSDGGFSGHSVDSGGSCDAGGDSGGVCH
jgi:hypothetical protein